MQLQSLFPIDEAQMNPVSFGQAIEQGSGQGVQIGFEFEVYANQFDIPAVDADSVDQRAKALKVLRDPYKQNRIFNIWRNDTKTIFDSSNIDLLDQVVAVRSRTDQAPLKWADILTLTPDVFVQVIRKKFEKLSSRQQKKIIDMTFNEYPDSKSNEVKFAQQAAPLMGQFRLSEALTLLMSRPDQKYTLEELIGLHLAVTGGGPSDPYVANWDLALDRFPKLISIASSYEHGTGTYTTTANALVPVLATAVGRKVNVFSRYHQKPKNLTDWYIEPDGSLDEAGPDEAGLEIVSPPLAANDAMQALKNFYSLAQTCKFQTNNSTGLHINVSIPQTVDPLKLALFLGDQHVLQQFGREDNDYASSVLKQLQGTKWNDTGWGNSDAVEVKGRKNQQYSKLKFKTIVQVARDLMDEHTVSISGENKKYFSFRHAGGDYLSDYAKIVNTVGRFVRAMLIASDPDAYRQEYLAKITKLIGPTADNPQKKKERLASQRPGNEVAAAGRMLSKLYQYALTRGLPALQHWSIGDYQADDAAERLKRDSYIDGPVTWTKVTQPELLRFAQSLGLDQFGPNYQRRLLAALDGSDESDWYSFFVSTVTVNSELKVEEIKNIYDLVEYINDIHNTEAKVDEIGTTKYLYVASAVVHVPVSNPQVQALFKALLAKYKALIAAQNTRKK